MAIGPGLIAGAALSFAKELAGPMITQTMSDVRDAAGWNDIARARELHYRLNQGSTTPGLTTNFTPVRFNCEQAILAFNQAPWHRADANPALRLAFWERLKSNLRFMGVNIDLNEVAQVEPAQPGPEGMAAREWARLIDMASEGPSLASTMRDFYRSRWLDANLRSVTEDELKFNLQRASIRRQSDRNRIMNPFYPWTGSDAYRLKWFGLVDNRGKESILEASGCVRAIDQEYIEHLARRLPDPSTLLHWTEQRLWDEQFTDLLHLRNGYAQSPVPDFFLKAQGIVAAEVPLPGEPAGNKDWLDLSFRSGRKVPTLAEAVHLQYRLRPSANDPGMSVIPNVPPWMERHTIAALVHHGVPEPVAKQLAASPFKVIDPNFAGATLGVAMEHRVLRQLQNTLFGPGTQWLEDDMQNFGFSPAVSKYMTAVLHQMAHDKAYADRLAKITAIRHEHRDGVMKAYEQGTITRADAIHSTRHRMFTTTMATRQCDNIDQKVIRDVNQVKIEGIKDAYMGGLLPPAQVQQQLTKVVVNPERVLQYMESWQWERTTKAKHLSTGEILAAMKAGLTTPQQAIMQLTNLGWRNPDAIAEVAIAQHQIQVAQAKQAAAVAAHQAATIQTEAHAKQAAKDKAQRQAVKDAEAKTAISKETAKANHKRLLAESTYYAKVHTADAAYAAAEKKGDQDTMDAQIAKSQAAYQKWLLDQLTLITQGPEVANVVGPLQTEPQPDTGQGQGTSQPPSSDSTPPTAPPEQTGGTPPPAPPG